MSTRSVRVMIVDDEKIIRDFFRRLLSLANIESVEAANGYEALELAKQNAFDIFFIDMRMPGMDGLETSRQIHLINPVATIMMITGYAMSDILKQAQEEGFGVIRKPFDIKEIKEVIDKKSL